MDKSTNKGCLNRWWFWVILIALGLTLFWTCGGYSDSIGDGIDSIIRLPSTCNLKDLGAL